MSLVSYSSSDVQWAAAFFLFCVVGVVRSICFICITLVVANSALPADRNAVNGLGQALVSLVRAVFPPIATALFAFTVRSAEVPWPFNWSLVWYIVAMASFGLYLLSTKLPSWIEQRRKDY